MKRYVPPPPGVDPEACRAPGEAEILADWEDRIAANARKVKHPARLGFDLTDVESEIRMALLTAIRKFYHEHHELPSGRWMTVVIQRRAMHFNRSCRVWHRVVEDMVRCSWTDDTAEEEEFEANRLARIPDGGDSVTEIMSRAEDEEAYRGLVYLLRTNMPPAAFAVLHLRIVEELTPREIADLAGIKTNARASKRIGYAKNVASAFLESLGIHTLDDVDPTKTEAPNVS